jgi:hypothetical protein
MDRQILMWEFNTKNFSIRWYISGCTDPDLSWDADNFFTEGLESGDYIAFNSEIAVFHGENKIGADYLCESIYEDPEEFRDHFGMKRKGYGSYFSDMVRNAIKQARETLSTQQ